MTLPLIDKKWKEGEMTRYAIRLRNNGETQEIGRIMHCIKENSESSSQNMLDLINETEIFSSRFKDHTEIRVDQSTMHPLQVETNLETEGGGTITISAEYQKKSIRLQAVLNQEKKFSEIKISSPCFDNGQIIWILRALDFSKIKSEELDIFNIFSGQKIRATLSPVGEEEVSVPAGLFSCHRVRMDIRHGDADMKQFFFIDRSEERLFIKNIMGPQTIELISINRP